MAKINEIDAIEIKQMITERVQVECLHENPAYRAMLAAIELRCWISQALKHLSLIDQTQLQDAQIRKLTGLQACLRDLSRGEASVHEVADRSADFEEHVMKLGSGELCEPLPGRRLRWS